MAFGKEDDIGGYKRGYTITHKFMKSGDKGEIDNNRYVFIQNIHVVMVVILYKI